MGSAVREPDTGEFFYPLVAGVLYRKAVAKNSSQKAVFRQRALAFAKDMMASLGIESPAFAELERILD